MDYFLSMSFYCAYESIKDMTDTDDMIAMETNTDNKTGIVKRVITGIRKILEKLVRMVTTFIRQFKMATGRITNNNRKFANPMFNARNDEDPNSHIENKSSNARKIINEMRDISQQYGHIAAYLDKAIETSMRRFSEDDDRYSGDYASIMSIDEINSLSSRVSELSQMMIRVDKVFTGKYESDIKGINAHLNSISNHINSMYEKCDRYQTTLENHPRDAYRSRLDEMNKLFNTIQAFSASLAKFMSVCQSALR